MYQVLCQLIRSRGGYVLGIMSCGVSVQGVSIQAVYVSHGVYVLGGMHLRGECPGVSVWGCLSLFVLWARCSYLDPASALH